MNIEPLQRGLNALDPDPIWALLATTWQQVLQHVESPAALKLDEHAAAYLLADAAVIADIEECAVCVGPRTYDVRPLLDPREHCPEVLDMYTLALSFARMRRLIESVPGQPGVVRLAPILGAHFPDTQASPA